MPHSEAITVQGLLDDVSLIGIGFLRIFAERRDDGGAATPSASEGEAEPGDDVDPAYALYTEGRDDGKGFRVVLDTTILAIPGAIRCTVEAEYELSDLRVEAITSDTMQEFVNNVALMNVLPFTRQGIADVTQRVFNAPLLMPIIKRGELSFSLPESGRSGD